MELKWGRFMWSYGDTITHLTGYRVVHERSFYDYVRSLFPSGIGVPRSEITPHLEPAYSSSYTLWYYRRDIVALLPNPPWYPCAICDTPSRGVGLCNRPACRSAAFDRWCELLEQERNESKCLRELRKNLARFRKIIRTQQQTGRLDREALQSLREELRAPGILETL